MTRLTPTQKKWLSLGVVLLVIVVIILIVVFALNDKKKKSDGSSNSGSVASAKFGNVKPYKKQLSSMTAGNVLSQQPSACASVVQNVLNSPYAKALNQAAADYYSSSCDGCTENFIPLCNNSLNTMTLPIQLNVTGRP